jgi:DNA polymerase-3 subunit chi
LRPGDPAMTEIDFYTHCADRSAIVARLCGKARAQGLRVRVLSADDAMTHELDRLLWTTPATGFLPHCRIGDRLAPETPIWIDHLPTHEGPAQLLINLCDDPPPFFARFERLAELISADGPALDRGRERYRFYRERGYLLRNHRMDRT